MLSGLAFGAVLVAAAIGGWKLLPKKQELWKTLPRERMAGVVIGVLALIWAGLTVQPLLEGPLAPLRMILWPLITFLAVAGYFTLEYLFTRAACGMLLLVVNYLMHVAFVQHAPIRPAFSLISYALGLSAIYFISSPYRFRDLLEQMTLKPGIRHGVCGFLLASGIITFIVFGGA